MRFRSDEVAGNITSPPRESSQPSPSSERYYPDVGVEEAF